MYLHICNIRSLLSRAIFHFQNIYLSDYLFISFLNLSFMIDLSSPIQYSLATFPNPILKEKGHLNNLWMYLNSSLFCRTVDVGPFWYCFNRHRIRGRELEKRLIIEKLKHLITGIYNLAIPPGEGGGEFLSKLNLKEDLKKGKEKGGKEEKRKKRVIAHRLKYLNEA